MSPGLMFTKATKAPPHMRGPGIPRRSRTAESVSEDDFEVEARKEAEGYVTSRQLCQERGRLRQENEQRKREGLPALKLPPKHRKIAGRSAPDTDEDRHEGFDSDVLLQYEGQRILPYNPLYALAGITDPQDANRAHQLAKAALVARLAGKTVTSGTEAEKSTACCRSTSSREQDEDEEAPEGSYDPEDEEVIVPWGASLADENEEEEEGRYSDDEQISCPSLVMLHRSMTARAAQPTSSPSEEQSLSLASQEELPARRPFFALADVPPDKPPFALDPSGTISVPSPINRYLKDYQREGVRFLYDHYAGGKGAILGDDMGLGKTVQVIAFLSAIMRKTGTRKDFRRRKDELRRSGGRISPQHWPTALIVCPTSLVRNWEREFETWGYFEHETWVSENADRVRKAFAKGYLDVVLVSYDATRTNIDTLKTMPFSVVIADEAHRLKQPATGITLAMKKFVRPICFALTGTLIQNRMDEIWSILDFVQRGEAGTLKQWREFAVNPLKKGHQYDGTAHDVVMGIMRLGAVHNKLLPHFYLRRDKRLIAHELPDKRDMVVFCPLAERQVLAYQRFLASEDVQFVLRRNEMCPCGSGKTRKICCFKATLKGDKLEALTLKSITACCKVANHLGLLYPSGSDNEHTREVNTALFEICMGRPLYLKKDNSVLAALDPRNCGKWTILEGLLRGWRVDAAKRNKVLIFSNSVRLLRMIGEFIASSLAFPFDTFTGELGGEARMAMVDRFQDPELDHFCLLISTKAGGVGLNLTAANKVVIFDPDWNPANDLQAMDRAFRIGQQRTVDVYRLIGQGTIEELVYQRQVQKQQRARQLNQGTFERRMHQGIEGGRNREEQGDLYGTHNIFRFNPKGFFPESLERIRAAEDQFAQDLVDAEYDEEEERLEEQGDNSEAEDHRRETLRERRKRDRLRLRGERKRQEQAERLVSEESEEDAPSRGEKRPGSSDDLARSADHGDQTNPDDLLPSLGVTAQSHEAVFKDSPEEKKIYELGLKLLLENPKLAETIKANDIGKHARKVERAVKETKRHRLQTDPMDEPWKTRIQASKKRPRALAELSD